MKQLAICLSWQITPTKPLVMRIADIALKMTQNPGPRSGKLNVHSGFSPFFALPQLRSLRCAEVFPD
jgi:hypothetical protein